MNGGARGGGGSGMASPLFSCEHAQPKCGACVIAGSLGGIAKQLSKIAALLEPSKHEGFPAANTKEECEVAGGHIWIGGQCVYCETKR